MRVHTQIETYLECSAKQLYGVIDVFHHAVKAVLHPVAPLFDAQGDMGEGRLRPLCVRALKRIFVMNDLDKVFPSSPQHSSNTSQDLNAIRHTLLVSSCQL